ncbi:MAG: type II toxin-antitoxin system VapC family toxin, partial [Blastocatellia bacterium]|nr:type II toxin-antitoxin system VapC family toxin [Blastocatellia bacterium]
MSLYFLDSSAIVKKYVAETGTGWVLNLHKLSAQNVIYVAQITGVEVVSAISRRLRGNKLTQKSADKAIFRFKRDFANKLRIIRLNDQIVSEAMQLSERHFFAVAMMQFNYQLPS